MLTETIALSASIALTATETPAGVDIAITHNGAVAFSQSYDDHEIAEAIWIAQDHASGIIAALKAADKALKAHARKLAKMSDEIEIVKVAGNSEWRIYRNLLASCVDGRAANAALEAAVAATRARKAALPAERAAAREALRAADRAAWDAKWGSLDAATAGYYREMGWMPARP